MKALKTTTISFLIFILAGTTSSQNRNITCPFFTLYEFGDGLGDTGNAVRILPFRRLPAARNPYGYTFPRRPDGRWSDGLTAAEIIGLGFGIRHIKPYKLGLSRDVNDGVTFAVGGSTILSKSFFRSRGINIPPYNTPLTDQLRWFDRFIKRNCSQGRTGCGKRRPSNSLIVQAFSEVNDFGYALTQGKSIAEVKSYVPLVIRAQVAFAQLLTWLNVTRIAYALAAPLGCYPYILTALPSNDTSAYDELGCLKDVNDLIVSYNNDLQTAFNAIIPHYPKVTFFPLDFYTSTTTVINETLLGPNGNNTLRACCGIGGRYNYDSSRFCGRFWVPFCPNPNDYIYWDGQHFTQEAQRRIVNVQIEAIRAGLNCTSS